MRLYTPTRLGFAISFLLLGIGLCLNWLRQPAGGPAPETVRLAQDLWGNKHPLTSEQKGTMLLYPFCPSTCGYCLCEGEFVRENYYRNAQENGQAFYGISLYSPQLELYSYTKHYHVDYPVLTAPFDLLQYHSGGFPWIVAYEKGQRVLSRPLLPYGKAFDDVNARLWQGKASLRLASGLKMAITCAFENEAHQTVYVLPDGSPERDKARNRLKENYQSVIVKQESQLTEEDLQKNLYFDGRSDQFSARYLGRLKEPIALSADSLRIGSYEFDVKQVGLAACIPSPFQRERYLILDIRGPAVRERERVVKPWLDYVVYRRRPEGKEEMLLHGWFAKDEQGWKWKEASAFGPAKATSSALVPSQSGGTWQPLNGSASPSRSSQRLPQGRRWTLGERECRFPRLALDGQDRCWVTWEEAGSIKVARLNPQGEATPYTMEGNDCDSYAPVVTWAGGELWNFYIADVDGVYRLYGRRLRGTLVSERFLVSDAEPVQAIMPAVASNRQGKILVAWSNWGMSERYLRYRLLDPDDWTDIRDVVTVKSAKGQICAWAPAVILDDTGATWGAWNQHYPADVCVCAGDLTETASVVTPAMEIGSFDGCGGYPAATRDSTGRRWVFWESFPLNPSGGTPQKILGAYWNTDTHRWSQPQSVSSRLGACFNQTPRAFTDSRGSIWVIWSGRLDDRAAWGIFVSCYDSGQWSPPERLSEEEEEARAPDCAVDSQQRLWATWHTGTGAAMRIRVVVAQVQKEISGTVNVGLR